VLKRLFETPGQPAVLRSCGCTGDGRLGERAAGLLTKRHNGREQLASGDVAAVRSVAPLLSELEQVWRGRIARIDELIAVDNRPEE
jgi:hypothetical protein